jgi:TetR/AcrR family tetracycline transcriptional repressor
MDQQHEQNLRHKIMAGNHLLKDAILSMRSYVEENALVGLKASITAHQNQENEKQLFLDSVTIYLQGLAVQKES